jgi:hypothetical protein
VHAGIHESPRVWTRFGQSPAGTVRTGDPSPFADGLRLPFQRLVLPHGHESRSGGRPRNSGLAVTPFRRAPALTVSDIRATGVALIMVTTGGTSPMGPSWISIAEATTRH